MSKLRGAVQTLKSGLKLSIIVAGYASAFPFWAIDGLYFFFWLVVAIVTAPVVGAIRLGSISGDVAKRTLPHEWVLQAPQHPLWKGLDWAYGVERPTPLLTDERAEKEVEEALAPKLPHMKIAPQKPFVPSDSMGTAAKKVGSPSACLGAAFEIRGGDTHDKTLQPSSAAAPPSQSPPPAPPTPAPPPPPSPPQLPPTSVSPSSAPSDTPGEVGARVMSVEVSRDGAHTKTVVEVMPGVLWSVNRPNAPVELNQDGEIYISEPPCFDVDP